MESCIFIISCSQIFLLDFCLIMQNFPLMYQSALRKPCLGKQIITIKRKCVSTNPATQSCTNSKCIHKNSFTCVEQDCKCNTDHEDCQKITIKFLQKRLQQKVKSITEIQNQIDDQFTKIIDQISELRDRMISKIDKFKQLHYDWCSEEKMNNIQALKKKQPTKQQPLCQEEQLKTQKPPTQTNSPEQPESKDIEHFSNLIINELLAQNQQLLENFTLTSTLISDLRQNILKHFLERIEANFFTIKTQPEHLLITQTPSVNFQNGQTLRMVKMKNLSSIGMDKKPIIFRIRCNKREFIDCRPVNGFISGNPQQNQKALIIRSLTNAKQYSGKLQIQYAMNEQVTEELIKKNPSKEELNTLMDKIFSQNPNKSANAIITVSNKSSAQQYTINEQLMKEYLRTANLIGKFSTII